MPDSKPSLSYEDLLKAYQEVEENSKILVRTDLELHKAKAEVDNQLGKLLLLNKLSDLIHATQDVHHILQTVCDSLITDLSFEKAWILYVKPSSDQPLLVEAGAAGGDEPRLKRLSEQVERVMKGRPQHLRFDFEAVHQDPAVRECLESLGVSEVFQAPLQVQRRTAGVLYAAGMRVSQALSMSHLSFFGMLSRQVSIAIENAQMHTEIIENNQLLEDRVALRSKELMDVNARLIELDAVKSNFISLVSHELRTPMTAIKGFATLLLEFGKRMDEEKRRSYFQKINEESDRLSRLIADLLNISRIESGRMVMRWKPIDLPAIIQRVFDNQKIQGAAVTYEMTVAADLPLWVADPDKLEQLVLNLVGNATRFTPAGQKVCVVAGRQGTQIRLQVINPGEGIAFEDLTKIFEKFYRVENEVNRRNRGTGLGLSICQGLVTMHGGQISVESMPNVETVFTIVLPQNLDKLADREQDFSVSLGKWTERGL